jgi:hypothetical protein
MSEKRDGLESIHLTDVGVTRSEYFVNGQKSTPSFYFYESAVRIMSLADRGGSSNLWPHEFSEWDGLS